MSTATLTTNFNFVMPDENEYYSIATVNQNTAAIDDAIIKNARNTYLVAAANSNAETKRRADAVCTTSDCFEKVTALINKMSDGDTLIFGAGTFDFYSQNITGIVLNKSIKIKGCGIHNTILKQQHTVGNTEKTAPVFRFNETDIVIEDLMLTDYTDFVAQTVGMVEVANDGAIFRNVFFVQNTAADKTGYCVLNRASSRFSRIENCRVYRNYSAPQKPMFNFSNASFSGIISGNIVSGYNGISIKFFNEDSKNKTLAFGNMDYTVIE